MAAVCIVSLMVLFFGLTSVTHALSFSFWKNWISIISRTARPNKCQHFYYWGHMLKKNYMFQTMLWFRSVSFFLIFARFIFISMNHSESCILMAFMQLCKDMSPYIFFSYKIHRENSLAAFEMENNYKFSNKLNFRRMNTIRNSHSIFTTIQYHNVWSWWSQTLFYTHTNIHSLTQLHPKSNPNPN